MQTKTAGREQQLPEPWADRELARLQRQLGERWEVWYVATPYDPAGPFSWSARPAGAEIAVCIERSPDDLLQQVAAYTRVLPVHIEDARAKLEADDLPEAQRRVLQALLAALLSFGEA
jgi:hypothetical protein